MQSTTVKNPLLESTPKNFGIGQSIQPKRNLSRFVKWPEYVRLQRQKKILSLRLKVPPSIAQFNYTLDKNTAAQAFKLFNKYRPETAAEKKERLTKEAAAVAGGKSAKDASPKPVVVKYGLNHVVSLIENKKAKLVLIANDVDPIELTSSVAALTDVASADEGELSKLISTINANYVEKYDENKKHWGGGIMGSKANDKLAKKAKAIASAS
ncbi:unnamed protein product [Candida parapsilosis]